MDSYFQILLLCFKGLFLNLVDNTLLLLPFMHFIRLSSSVLGILGNDINDLEQEGWPEMTGDRSVPLGRGRVVN